MNASVVNWSGIETYISMSNSDDIFEDARKRGAMIKEMPTAADIIEAATLEPCGASFNNTERHCRLIKGHHGKHKTEIEVEW